MGKRGKNRSAESQRDAITGEQLLRPKSFSNPTKFCGWWGYGGLFIPCVPTRGLEKIFQRRCKLFSRKRKPATSRQLNYSLHAPPSNPLFARVFSKRHRPRIYGTKLYY